MSPAITGVPAFHVAAAGADAKHAARQHKPQAHNPGRDFMFMAIAWICTFVTVLSCFMVVNSLFR